MKRRNFLKNSALSVVAAHLGVHAFGRQALASNNRKMFYVFLRGGLDGLFAFPTNDSTFIGNLRTRRPGIGILLNNLNANYPNIVGGLRVHKSLPILNSPNTLIIPHVGSKNTTRSHFEQMDFIEGGNTDERIAQGFLARACLLQQSKSLAVGKKVPLSLRGSDPLVVGSSAMISDSLTVKNSLGEQARLVARTNANFGLKDRLKFLSGLAPDEPCVVGARLCERASKAGQDLGAAQSAELSGAPTRDPFKLAVKLSQSHLQPRFVTIDLLGFDTHADQTQRLLGSAGDADETGGLLDVLNQGLTTMKNELGSDWSNTVIVVMSEFGRTVVENGTSGTDHGRGGAMIVMGGSVQSSQANLPFGRVWNLSPSYVEGVGPSQCPAVKYDYRDILGHILHSHMGLSLANVFGGMPGGSDTSCFPSYVRQFNPGFIQS